MDPLTEAVRNAYVLLRHASERGIVVPTELAATIGAMGAPGKHDPAQEARFWSAYGTLAKSVQPVTVASLLATAPPTPGSALKAVASYRNWAYGVLLVLAILQTFTLIGTKSLTDLKGLSPRLQDNGQRLWQLNATMFAPKAGQKTAAEPSAKETYEFNRLRAVIQEDAERLQACQNMLLWWRGLWHLEHAFFWVTSAVLGGPPAASAGDAAAAPTAASAQQACAQASNQHFQALLEAEVALTTLQDYVLPFFYGLLGTCVFILRNLTSAVKDLTYTSDVAYKLRMPLGGLAGVAITLLPAVFASTPKLAGVTPLALAFVAGYSVELLFTAMDRFVGAFTGDGAPQRAAGTPS